MAGKAQLMDNTWSNEKPAWLSRKTGQKGRMYKIPHSLAASSWTDHVIRYINRGIRDRHHSKGLKGAESDRISARTAVADEKRVRHVRLAPKVETSLPDTQADAKNKQAPHQTKRHAGLVKCSHSTFRLGQNSREERAMMSAVNQLPVFQFRDVAGGTSKLHRIPTLEHQGGIADIHKTWAADFILHSRGRA